MIKDELVFLSRLRIQKSRWRMAILSDCSMRDPGLRYSSFAFGVFHVESLDVFGGEFSWLMCITAQCLVQISHIVGFCRSRKVELSRWGSLLQLFLSDADAISRVLALAAGALIRWMTDKFMRVCIRATYATFLETLRLHHEHG